MGRCPGRRRGRELFFRRCMPGFDLKETPFYILTHAQVHS